MKNAVMVSDRVYLRPFEVEDAGDLAEGSHHETDTFMERGRDLHSPIAFEHYIKELYEQQPTDGEVQFAVCLTETDECIGMIGLEFVDLINGVAETGSWFHKSAYRSKGYGTEAKHLILEYAFDRLHLERIISFVFESNTRSAAALAKQGYQPAGRLKYDDFKDGRYQDVLLFDLLREDWLSARDQWREQEIRRKQEEHA
ncbi:MAG: GNAT family protein [Thermomicrobiaceae bacterium]